MNNRPLPCVLAGFVLGEVWIWQFHGTTALAALIFAAIMFLIIGGKKRGSFFVLFLIGTGVFLGGIRQYQWETYKTSLNKWKRESDCLIQGQIEEIIKKEYSFSLLVGSLKINGEQQGGKLLVYMDEGIDCYIGSQIEIKGEVEDFEDTTNPGEFDQKKYREGKGILGVVYDAELIGVRYGSFLIKDGIYGIREKTAAYLEEHMREDTNGIGIAMALGDKTNLLEEQKLSYELGGISHVLAVSGLHMSLLGAGIYKIFRKIGFGYSISVISSIPCIFVYAVMTGMSSSCLRAAIMLLIYLIAELKGYYYDLPSSLAFAGIWLLMEIPQRLFDSGFVLSFGAMISVGVICPFLFRIFEYETGIRKIRDSFLSGAIITIFTLPLSLYFFYGISAAGLLLNLVVIPLMTPLVPLLFVGGMGWLPIMPEALSLICLKPAEMVLGFYNFLCKLAEKVPFSYIQAGFRGIPFAVSYYVLLILCILILYCCYKNKKFFGIFLTPLLLAGLISFLYFTGRNDSFMTVLDVGQGDGILYHSAHGEVCVIDGGSTSEKNIGKYVIRPALEYYGIASVDYWFISHFDEDHISGLKELLEAQYPIKNLILPMRKEVSDNQKEIESLALLNGSNLYYMKQGDKLKLKEDVFSCLYPQNRMTGTDENQNSMVLLLETEYQQILLTGDIEKEGETNMNRYLDNYPLNKEKERILKVGHHGSANGTKEELLDIFRPDTAVISCSIDNSYGHPAGETVDRLNNAGTLIFYTMKQGAIEIKCDENTRYFAY